MNQPLFFQDRWKAVRVQKLDTTIVDSSAAKMPESGSVVDQGLEVPEWDMGTSTETMWEEKSASCTFDADLSLAELSTALERATISAATEPIREAIDFSGGQNQAKCEEPQNNGQSHLQGSVLSTVDLGTF